MPPRSSSVTSHFEGKRFGLLDLGPNSHSVAIIERRIYRSSNWEDGYSATMETNNPYEPPHRNVDKRRRFRVSLSSTEIFTVGAVFALLVLMFAPAQPHPKEYTASEKILIALT
jgi:hypothetical protein